MSTDSTIIIPPPDSPVSMLHIRLSSSLLIQKQSSMLAQFWQRSHLQTEERVYLKRDVCWTAGLVFAVRLILAVNDKITNTLINHTGTVLQ